MPSSIGTEPIKIRLPNHDDIRNIAKGPPARKPDPTDWQAQYIPPGTEANPGRFWVLPQLSIILDDLKFCGGRTANFAMMIVENADLQQLLMLQIHEQLAQEGNEIWLEKFKAIVTFGKKAQLAFGIDKALDDYRESGEMNPSLLSKLGAQAMPETFGTSAVLKAADEKAVQEEQSKAVDGHIADLE